MSDEEQDLLCAKYTGGVDEYEKKRAKNLSKLKDVDVGDGGDDLVSEELVVEGEPEPLKADLLLEDDSDVEIVVQFMILFVHHFIEVSPMNASVFSA